nr:heavy metal-associated domain-containing protein [Arthrobacter sp. H14]
MCGTTSTSELTLTDRNESSCSCCATEPGAVERDSASTGANVRTDFGVTGLTCGGCASTVKKTVSTIGGVKDVNVDVVAGGISTLTITAENKIEFQQVAEVVSQAGYELTDR